MILSNAYLLYAFLTGKTIFEDSDIRVGLQVIGSKESIYTYGLVNIVYAFGIYYIQKNINLWQKLILIVAILSVYISLVYAFRRGTLVSLGIITIYSIISSKKAKQGIVTLIGLFIMLGGCYLIFGDILRQKGYDPIEKITETAQFATDIHNPDWDKGRFRSQEIALNAWKKNIWAGAGYDELYHYGLPEDVATAHNGIITSLFQGGIIGTLLMLSITLYFYINSFKLWNILIRVKSYEREVIKLLIVISVLWIIPFMTEEQLREKYSLSIQFLYLGLLNNIYLQIKKKKKLIFFIDRKLDDYA